MPIGSGRNSKKNFMQLRVIAANIKTSGNAAPSVVVNEDTRASKYFEIAKSVSYKCGCRVSFERSDIQCWHSSAGAAPMADAVAAPPSGAAVSSFPRTAGVGRNKRVRALFHHTHLVNVQKKYVNPCMNVAQLLQQLPTRLGQ